MSDFDLFAKALRDLKTEASYSATSDETATTVRAVVRQSKASSVVVAGLPPSVKSLVLSSLEDVKVIEAEKLDGREAIVAISGADLGITWAANGLVKEGALLEVTRDDAAKLASSLPTAHIALLSAKSLLPDLEAGMLEAGRIVASSAHPKPIISFIAGPSETGDIEGRLLYGVHGPHSLSVVVLGWI